MANEETIVKKLKSSDCLKCSICTNTYTDPKQLQCYHVFCKKCLEQVQKQCVLTCPMCRQVTSVPANGVAGLQPAFYTSKLLEIVQEHSSENSENVSADVIVCCRSHYKREVGVYCATCEEPICLECTNKGGEHWGHKTEPFEKAFKGFTEEITSSLVPSMEKQLTTVKEALDQFETCCEEISDQRAAIEADIHDTFKRLNETLDARKTQLINQLHQIVQKKLKDLGVQRDQVETILAQLSSSLKIMKDTLEARNEQVVLMMKKTTVEQAKNLTTSFQPNVLEPKAKADLVFSTLQDLTTMCKNYGQIVAPNLPDPSKCHVMGKLSATITVGETSVAILQAIDFSGEPCDEPFMTSECELVSEITGISTMGTIKKASNSQSLSHYSISYQPTIKGRHQHIIKVNGQHIRGSPFEVMVKPQAVAANLEAAIQSLDFVMVPGGVALTWRGEVVVTERGSKHCVSVFSPRGKKLQSFGGFGSWKGQFKDPCGVAIDNMGDILVADYGNSRIQKFTAEGRFLTKASIDSPAKPLDLAFNPCNSMLYITTSDHTIQVLNSDLTPTSTFGKGQLNHPYALTCDTAGKVYVADTYNHRIQVFTAEGELTRMFELQMPTASIYFPFGIAVDTDGIMYVSEGNNDRVSVFTSKGRFVASLGKSGSENGEFLRPRGLAVDGVGVLYVCDMDNNRVQVF